MISGYVAGAGYIAGDISSTTIITISGEVTGVGALGSTTTTQSPIRVSGSVTGFGAVDYYINSSRSNTINPYLTMENLPYDPGDFPIAAIEYDGFSPNKIISITHRDEEVYENTDNYEIIEELVYHEESGLYPIAHYPYSTSYNSKLSYLVTEFNSDGQNGKPLFYQYEALYDISSSISGVININVYRNNETKLKETEYKIQYSYDYLSDSNLRYSSTTWDKLQNKVKHRARILLPHEAFNNDVFYTIEYSKTVNNISSYQKELVELKPIYDTSDYTIVSSGLVIRPSSRIQNTGTPLNIVKDPASKISIIDLITIKGGAGYLTDRVAQWKLRLNIGAFQVASGFYTGQPEKIYNLEDHYTSGIYTPLTNIKPEIVSSNIIHIKESPIYIDEAVYTYPNYVINAYDKTTSGLLTQSGTFALDVNGVTRTDIKIKSIDRVKGFIELNKDIDPTDEVEVTYYLDNDGWVLIENLELNPKVNDLAASYHISGYYDGLGIALRPWDGLSGTFYPYIYNTASGEANRTAYAILPSPQEDTVGVAWSAYDFVPIAEIDINRLTTDMVKLTDARRSAGGINRFQELDEWMKTTYGDSSREINWYTDKGNYDGIPLPHGNTILIHIPSEKFDSEKQNWINHYKDTLGATEGEKKGIQEFNYYLDQVIRRYISAGTNYVLLPTTSGVFGGQITELR